jgi:hypothetical protein
MLHSMNDLKGFQMRATDGDLGEVTDLYFDDEAWVIRYFVVRTGSWLSARSVLISPIGVGMPDWSEKVLPVSVNRDQIRNSPSIDTDKPVSRQHEATYLRYYGYPYYWGGVSLWGGAMYPASIVAIVESNEPQAARLNSQIQTACGESERQAEVAHHRDDDLHLRSGNAVMNYHIHATDGDIGHVQGLMVDEKTWAIRYMIVHTSNWWLGHDVLIAPEWIDAVSWPESKVCVDVTRDAIKSAPAYDSSVPVNRQQELTIHAHYGKVGYWPADAKHDSRDAAA